MNQAGSLKGRPASSLRRWSDMLAAFGAVKSAGSATSLSKRGSDVIHSHREQFRVQVQPDGSAYMAPHVKHEDVETQTDTVCKTATILTSETASETSIPAAAEIEPHEQDDLLDNINVASRAQVTTEPRLSAPPKNFNLRQRSNPTRVAKIKSSPKVRPVRSSTRSKKNSSVLYSDTQPAILVPVIPKIMTERGLARQTMRETTKPKRDAFLRAHAEFFIPVLPSNNYIDKLQRSLVHDEICPTSPYELLDHQPTGVTAVMKPYQLEGLSFLVHMHRNGMSAILGDEMGLGKTLQTLSIFQYLAESEPSPNCVRPHLVICPLSVLSSWVNEARRWVPNLRTIRFHGPVSERDAFKKTILTTGNHVDLIITTYDTFVAEQSWLKRAFAWRYCVLDEGHKIKNDRSEVSSALQSLQAEYRLLLTGTPLQNDLREMWSLLHWLLPEVFTKDTADVFKRSFDLSKGQVSTKFMHDARRLLELMMLRRMKTSANVNLDLPPKTEILLYAPLTPIQRFWYTRLITKMDGLMFEELFKDAKEKEMQAEDSQRELLKLELDQVSGDDTSGHLERESKQMSEISLQEGSGARVASDWRKMMNLVMQLRKICIHPYLNKHALPNPYILGDHVVNASGKFILLDKLLDELVVRRGKRVLVFSGFTTTLDLCEDLLTMKNLAVGRAALSFSRLDGSTNRARRNLAIRLFNDPNSEERVMLISTRAGGLGINLVSASDVIFLDEDWNPQVTLQAEARVHRIGQTKPVTIYKVCSQGTVEEQMMGRIRKKLYLSTKITESMRNIHGAAAQKNRKRKLAEIEHDGDGDAPKMGTSQLKSLLRRGTQTLTRPTVDIGEMSDWTFDEMMAKCGDTAEDTSTENAAVNGDEEQFWLNSMERVETAIFEGRQHHRALEKQAAIDTNLDRKVRRIGKNTTVMVNGFAVSKESMSCGNWEAVPTMAGKDPRLAEPVREKKAAIVHQGHCQRCRDGGDLICCSGCPRGYHYTCLELDFKKKARGANFFCPQHVCHDCGARTSDAGGMLYRCRWCEDSYCEDCLDWDNARLVGKTLMEYEMLGHGESSQAYYIECSQCIQSWADDVRDKEAIAKERKEIEQAYQLQPAVSVVKHEERPGDSATPSTTTEVITPRDEMQGTPGAESLSAKKCRYT